MAVQTGTVVVYFQVHSEGACAASVPNVMHVGDGAEAGTAGLDRLVTDKIPYIAGCMHHRVLICAYYRGQAVYTVSCLRQRVEHCDCEACMSHNE